MITKKIRRRIPKRIRHACSKNRCSSGVPAIAAAVLLTALRLHSR
ncbi:hypothetical protein [Paenibacillus lactis]|nr:hypothetical protein [Paenibacillus lactis]